MGWVSIIGLDLAKNVFQVHGAQPDGSVAFRRKLSRQHASGARAGHMDQVIQAQPPLAHRAVVRAGNEPASVWAKGEVGHRTLVPAQHDRRFSRRVGTP